MNQSTKSNAVKVVQLADVVNVQPEAVVSREIMSKPTGTVTLFAFDAGEGLSEHTAPFDAMVYALEGDVDVTISGEHYTLHAGEMLIMPADEPHALKAITAFKMLLVMIR
jgi:quercetin dioxygenase-like cupin family protein